MQKLAFKKDAAVKLIRRLELYSSLKGKLIGPSGAIHGFDDHVGSFLHNPIGISTCHNSSLTSLQLIFAIAMGEHPLINKLIIGPNNHEKVLKRLGELVRGKVLEGQKILDLGCGFLPGFARCARALGADTFTVDIIPAEKFNSHFYENGFGQVERELEMARHICLDLRDRDAMDRIVQITGGNFDLVTSAHLDTGWDYGEMPMYPPSDIRKLVIMRLLKNQGIYFNANPYKKPIMVYDENECFACEEPRLQSGRFFYPSLGHYALTVKDVNEKGLTFAARDLSERSEGEDFYIEIGEIKIFSLRNEEQHMLYLHSIQPRARLVVGGKMDY